MCQFDSRWVAALCLLFVWFGHSMAAPSSPVRIVVSFSILEDIVRQIGGSDVEVTTLIGADSDAHVFEPRPDQARLLAKAQLFVVNGLGFETWLTRLTRSAQFGGMLVSATEGVTPIMTTEAGETSPVPDPHAWQNPTNVIIYADNIARALAEIDPTRAKAYRQRLQAYKLQLAALDHQLRAEFDQVPVERRRVITTHDAFAYYGRTYGIVFMAAEGISTDSEPSAKSIAELIRQIRREGIKALFLENIADPRLIDELARDTGTTPGPRLYSDALSRPGGPAPTYIRMIEYNTAALKNGMLKN